MLSIISSAMDVYRQAAEIVDMVRNGSGTAKALCLRKETQKKKQTYAVVCETLRHYDLLTDVLESAEFFKYYPRANRSLAMVLSYDQVIGKGVNTNSDTTARAIRESSTYLRDAYWNVEKHHVIAPRATDNLESNEDGEQRLKRLPRYARVNTLKITQELLLERLAAARESKKRLREEEDTPSKSGAHRLLPPFTEDPVVPNLLVFAPGVDLHAHPAVRRGQLVLQDRSSCLPAAVLLDAVPCKTTFAEERKPLEFIIDACAAPGNKTTQLAALGASWGVKILALEKDERRAELLQSRVQTLGAASAVNVAHMDFFDLVSSDREATEAILLDPSCSASGVVSRVDVELMYQRKAAPTDDAEATVASSKTADEQENEFSSNTERVAKLARLQRKLLAHSLLSFDNCRTVVYSTCSVHEAENEGVLREVLNDPRVQARGWTLTNILPSQWQTRGVVKGDDIHPIQHAIRCDPHADATNGFFVARFDRPTPSKKAPAAAAPAVEEEDDSSS